MRFTVGKFDYVVEFEYEQNSEAYMTSLVRNAPYLNDNPDTTIDNKAPNITKCRILRGQHGQTTRTMEIYAEGKAARSVLDAFVKEKGRKAALTDALSKPSLLRKKRPEKTFRAKIWNTYFGRGEKAEVHCFVKGRYEK